MKLWRFEGSPEEFSAVASVLMADGEAKLAEQAPDKEQKTLGGSESKALGRKLVTVAEAKEVITRRDLSAGQLNVLRVLYQAGDRRVTSEELMKVNNHSSDQFRGLMGAFGRRVVNTVGSATWFFDDKWSYELGQNTYRLPPSVTQAIDELNIL